MKNPSQIAGAACLAVGLVSTWDATPANAAEYSFAGSLTPTHDLNQVYFLFSTGPCAPVFSKKISDFIGANTTAPFSFSMFSIPDGVDVQNGFFTVASLYDNPVNGTVSLGMNLTDAAGFLPPNPPTSWSDNFIGSRYVGFESDIASALQSGMWNGTSLDDQEHNTGLLISSFYGTWSGSLQNSDFTLVNFSDSSFGGSGTISVVPEPATFSLLAVGLTLVLFRSQKRNTA
jgi:hypothetical protein